MEIVPTDHGDRATECLHCAVTKFIIGRGVDAFDREAVIGSLTHVIADIIGSSPDDPIFQQWALDFAARNTKALVERRRAAELEQASTASRH